VRGSTLSLEHNDSNTPKAPRQKPLPDYSKTAKVRYTPDGSFGHVPSLIPFSQNPVPREAPPAGIRGEIDRFSDGARVRAGRFLDTIRRDAVGYSMCLTCAGTWTPEWNAFAKQQFLILCKRMAASRDADISRLGVFWKQELQKREAVHFHLLLWGVDPNRKAMVQAWIAEQWNNLACVGLGRKAKSEHLYWHARPENFFVIERSKYFTKYLGKDAEAAILRDPIPGKWWGKFNSRNIPVAEMVVVSVTPQVRVWVNRIIRKVRQKQLNAAKHYQICKDSELLRLIGEDKGKPCVSEFGVQCGKKRDMYWAIAAVFGNRFGPVKPPKHYRMSECSVSLSGPSAPLAVSTALEYALARESAETSDIPY
jgi:hypothetical protein